MGFYRVRHCVNGGEGSGWTIEVRWSKVSEGRPFKARDRMSETIVRSWSLGFLAVKGCVKASGQVGLVSGGYVDSREVTGGGSVAVYWQWH